MLRVASRTIATTLLLKAHKISQIYMIKKVFKNIGNAIAGFLTGMFLPMSCLFFSLIIAYILKNLFVTSDIRIQWVEPYGIGVLTFILFSLLVAFIIKHKIERKIFGINLILGFLMFVSMGWHQPYMAQNLHNQLHIGMPADNLQRALNKSNGRFHCTLMSGDKTRRAVPHEQCFEAIRSLPKQAPPAVMDISVLFRGPGFSTTYFSIKVGDDGNIRSLSSLGGLN